MIRFSEDLKLGYICWATITRIPLPFTSWQKGDWRIMWLVTTPFTPEKIPLAGSSMRSPAARSMWRLFGDLPQDTSQIADFKRRCDTRPCRGGALDSG